MKKRRGARWAAVGACGAMVFAYLTGLALPAHAAASTIISLTFDDGNADQMTAEATMKNLGLHGTFFVPSGWIDQPSYVTSANLQQIYADGNEIAGHTVTHPDLVNLPTDEVTRQVCNGRVALMNMGFKVTSFAYPFADQDAAVQTVVKNCGFNSARGLGDLYSKDDPSLPASESIPPANPYDTAAPEEVDSTWTLQNLEDSVTKAQAAGGGWVQLTFHHIATGTDPTLTISPSLFSQFSSWLAQQQTAGNVAVKTVDQVIGGAVQPAVAGPPAPPPPAQGTNMIQNPSLETLANGIPQCWAAGGYGTNTTAYSVVSPGHTGNNAELLTMSGYVSGDAKLLPALDLGGCSPTGTPGHIYSLSAWYKSNVITQFEVYYRTGTGYWTYWTASPQYTASSNWTQVSWTTPALPAGASGISYGLNIQANGSITTDDYSMIDVTPTAPTAPAAPTGVTATAGNGSAAVSWTAPANGGSAITSYAVTPHAGTTTLAPVTVTGNPPATTANVTGLTNGTAYTFTVTATNSIGTSPASAASAPVTPTAPTVPAAPTGVTATAGNASAVVSWTAPANGGSPLTSYTVTPSSGGTALAPVTVSGNPPSTTATVTGLSNGTAYTFTATASNAVGTSQPSAASAPVTPSAPVPGVSNGGFESGLGSWTTGGVKAPVASTIAHTGTGSALLGLASGAEPLGDSSLSQTITVPATGTSTLSFWYQPHTADDTCTGTTCRYDWMEAQVRSTTGTTLASVFKLCNNNGTWTQLSANLSAYAGQSIVLWFNVHLDGSSPADDTWMYLDDATLTNSQTTPTAPAAPTGVSATAGNASATVSWTAPANGGSAITSYAVTPHTGTTTLAPVTVTGNPPATTANVTGLTNGTAYTFTVTATNAIGTSPASAASAPATPTAGATAPAAPTGVSATAGNASATVSWTAPANGGSAITSYAVTPHTGTTTLAPVTVSGNPPATTANITGLTNGTAYTFTVTATNAIGTSPASAASAPATPTAGATSPTITNGGFESGLSSWTTGGVKAPVASTIAHTGTGSALLGVASGAEPLGDSSLSQTITVPATGTSTLSFWYQPHSQEDPCTGNACPYDWMEAQVRSTSGTTLASLLKLCNNNGTWAQFSADLTAYKGQTITLWFNVHLDGSTPADDTWMYLDDVTLTNG
ncbi:fibronectin type III domain-containing protein [Arthrobacter bambusae]|uniref:fibronectin type III domain-containing protein n=1 Tax=Arthrobacter bambusae TaxID=1338426 RepID=UPI0027848EEE|nr:fibronectin type III domain-containing protein [Arthrobacter bambusae]MDQ0029900.1 peptidoglycan/xylan/chitin deacetylase (PgdA/CDA1 family)/mRNA-degrading endonuclease toxin of MazEF toxin-antitoxin module [Arthrobacter bambusae]MDQ0097582.1 peptidoglycan/xylan/chitin deacetylase (PgdA/CDA1 family)/mRNA-degrading endonuclease toxin of MazEF toxin-antitoxin module [Arthrobacter bambusae]